MAMANNIKKINIPTKKIAEFCQRNHIRKLSLFGSVLGENFNPESDVDILVEFKPGKGPGYIGLAHMQRELSIIIGGRTIDLRTSQELSRYFREEVCSSAEVQYEEG